MSKKLRDWMFIIFIILFIFLSVFTSLYASGYRFNLDWPIRFDRLLQKTGLLATASSPKGAYIFLNDRPQKNSAFSLLKKDYLTTPAKIKNLLPGDYVLRLEKEGYWNAERKIKIESGQTTFAEDINLFLSDLPILMYAANNETMSLAPGGQYVYLSDLGQVVELENGQELIKDTDYFLKGGFWLGNSQKILANNLIFDLNKKEIINLESLVGSGAKDWQYNQSDEHLYYRGKDTISRLDNDYRSSSILIQGEDFLTYQPKGEQLFAIVKNANKLYLKSYSLRNGDKLGELELPAIGNYRFWPGNEEYLSLYDNDNKTLYLVNATDWKKSQVIKNVKNWSWISSEELIYNDDWEISTVNLTNGSSHLITRFSEPIRQVLWHQKGRYFIFATEKSLHIGDANSYDTILIFKTEKISNLILDEKNNLLYFYAKIGQQEGLHKLLLQ